MGILIAVALFVPSIVVAQLLWRRVARRGSSIESLGSAIGVAVAAFWAMQFLTLFLLTSFGLTRECPEIFDDTCLVLVVAEAFRWWFLVASSVCALLAYVGMKYCDRGSSAKQAR